MENSASDLLYEELTDSQPSQDKRVFNRRLRAKSASNHSKKKLFVLSQSVPATDEFAGRLAASGEQLSKADIEILQINLGKMCNLRCEHCHVEAGPDRTEVMSSDLLETLRRVAEELKVRIVDLTGGAPEMCPAFKEFVRAFRALGCEVIVRSNLVILLEPGYEDFIDFFTEHKLRVVASLPCYLEENVDAQRGTGAYEKSIDVLRRLNQVGYGRDGSGLVLDLVYNPLGPFLPGSQKGLETAYKKELDQRFGIAFNSLITITNLPIGRFYSNLKKQDKTGEYDRLLMESFNIETVPHLMCRTTLSVSWDGWLYDCDFNQMLELPLVREGRPIHICDLEEIRNLKNNKVFTGNHCFGCTAGAGSSCTGELVEE